MVFVWIALGGAIGSVARAWLSLAVSTHFGQLFPWGTLIINVSGSFIIGFFATLTGSDGTLLVGTNARSFFQIGVCGGYTTFSSFSLQTLQLAQDGEWLWAAGNVVASNVGCLLAVWLGHVCAVAIRR